MPFYPQLPRIARIEGDVRLRVTTDESAVTSVRSGKWRAHAGKGRSGQRPDLEVRASRPNFFRDSVFLQLVTDSCDPDVPDNGRVILKLPTEVDISSHLRVRGCHDRNEGLDLSEPLRVLLTGCEIDGSPVACEAFNVRLHSGNARNFRHWRGYRTRKAAF